MSEISLVLFMLGEEAWQDWTTQHVTPIMGDFASQVLSTVENLCRSSDCRTELDISVSCTLNTPVYEANPCPCLWSNFELFKEILVPTCGRLIRIFTETFGWLCGRGRSLVGTRTQR